MKIRYPKVDFNGSDDEKAYMYGFWLGDLSSRIDGRQIRISGSSTKKEFCNLFKQIFKPYGRIKFYYDTSIRTFPRSKKQYIGCWKMYALLNRSFSFILSPKRSNIPEWIKPNFYSFLAGLIDAEGSLGIYKSHEKYFEFVLRISNNDEKLLKNIRKEVKLKSYIYLSRGKNSSLCYNTKDEVVMLLSRIKPYLKLKYKRDMTNKIINNKNKIKFKEII